MRSHLHLPRRHAAAATALALVLTTMTALPAFTPAADAQDGPAIALSKDMAAETLYGDVTEVTLTASNSTGTDTFNATFSDVLPAGASIDASTPPPTSETVLGDGRTVVVWDNVADLQAGTSAVLTYTMAHTVGVNTIGTTITNEAQVFTNTDVRVVPDVDPLTGDTTGDANSNASASDTTEIIPFELTKTEPNAEAELLRGVHDHQTVYRLEIQNNYILPTSGLTIDDWIPAGLEFLGCGTVDNTTIDNDPGTAPIDEYTGSGVINPGNAPAAPDCIEPTLVETVMVDPDGPLPDGPLPNAVYTHVQWSSAALAGKANMSAGGVTVLEYIAAIPQYQNSLFPAAPDTIGSQTANLDNNRPPSGLTTDEQEWTNYAVVTGTTGGTLYDDDDHHIVIAEDISIHKTVSPATVAQGGINIWTLEIETGEYTAATGPVTVTDTVPDGLSVTAVSDGGSASENADGTWTVTWNLASVSAPSLSPGRILTITTVVDEAYTTRGTIPADRPVSTNDELVNTVDLIAPTATIWIDNALTPQVQSIPDESSASIIAEGISINKTVRQAVFPPGTVIDCFDGSGSYVELAATYTPGDRVCWKLEVDFPSGLDTPDLVIRDYLPAGYEFQTFEYTGGNTAGIAAFTDAGLYQEWDYADVETGGLHFEILVDSILVDPLAVADGDLTANLMKVTYQNIDDNVFQLRDDANAVAALPVLTIDKAVEAIDGVTTGFPAATASVEGGDLVTFSVTVANTGTRDAEATEISDVLPVALPCTAVEGPISDGGVCAGVTITWPPVLVPAGGSVTYTYDIRVPADVTAGVTYTNTATVDAYEVTLNTVDSPMTYVPGVNTPALTDSATLTTPNATVEKTRTTSLTQLPGNALADQATIGENIVYTVTTTIPEGTTIPGPVTVRDIVSDRLTIVGTPTYTIDTGTGAGAPQNATVAGQTITVPLSTPAYTNAPDSGDDIVELTFTARVDNETTNFRGSGTIGNTAALRSGTTDVRVSGLVNTTVVEPNLVVTKDENDADDIVEADEELVYTVTVTNPTGTAVSAANDVVIIDTPPSQLRPISGPLGTVLTPGQTVSSGGVWDGTSITWTGADAAGLLSVVPGGTVTLAYDVRVANPLVGSSILENTVTGTATSLPAGNPNAAFERGPGDPAANGEPYPGYTATATDSVQATQLSVAKSVDVAEATVGETIEYTLGVTIPAGVVSYDTTVLDTLPAGVTYIGSSASTCDQGGNPCSPGISAIDLGVNAGNTLGFFLGDLTPPAAADRVVTLTYTVYVDSDAGDGDTVTNSANVYGNQTDQITGTPPAVPAPGDFDNAGEPGAADVDILEPALTVDKDVDGQVGDTDTRRAAPGDTLDFTVTVANTGTGDAFDVTVADVTDTRFELGTVAAGGGYIVTDGNPSDGTLGWTIATIPAGNSVTITYSLVVPNDLDETDEVVTGPEFTNTADVTQFFGLPAADRVPGRFETYTDVPEDTVTIELDLASIGNFVWFDKNGDGVQDGGDEAGLEGVRVVVTWGGPDGIIGGANAADDVEYVDVTDANGLYLVEELPGGTYNVTVDATTLPVELSPTWDLDDLLVGPDGIWDGTLAEDGARRDVDFGYNGDAAIGDLVWLDLNADGVYDPADGEVPLTGVPVTVTWAGPNGILGDGDDVDYVDTTDANGIYGVNMLPGGLYEVTVGAVAAGLTPTYDLDDLLVGPDGVWTGTLGATEDKTNVDFGYVGPGAVGDTVYLDLNGNGAQDAGEPGIPGVTVTITSAGPDGLPGNSDDIVIVTATNADGVYGQAGLPYGDVAVALNPADLPDGLVPTQDPDGGAPNISVTELTIADPVDRDQDFGYVGPGSIGDTVWLDLDGNGVQDADEPGIPGVTVTVTYLGGPGPDDDISVDAVTGANGTYLVDGLPLGDYTVTVDPTTLPAGLSQTYDATTPLDDNTSSVTLTDIAPDNLDQDFGYQGAGSIGDTVWLDQDADGALNGGEIGIPEVDVVVTYLGGPGAADDMVILTTTDANGFYEVTGLPDGDYTVEVLTATLPADLTQTYDATDPQGDSASAVSLVDGNRNRDDQDFGYVGSAALGDLVWLDGNADGEFTPGPEAGIPGVELTVTYAGLDNTFGTDDDLIFVVETNAIGEYDLVGLPAGLYTVTVTDALATLVAPTYDEDSGLVAPDHTTLVDLAVGEVHDTADFGYEGGTVLGDTVWLDLNGDGDQDPGEPGIPGVVVQVVSGGLDGVIGTGGDDVTLTVTTDENGEYTFIGLEPGEQQVTLIGGIPDGLVPTYDLDSGTTGPDNTTTVDLLTIELGADFGLVGPGAIGDQVWLDLDGDPSGYDPVTDLGLGEVDVQVTYAGLDGTFGTDDDIVFVVTTAGLDDIDPADPAAPLLGEYGIAGLPLGDYMALVIDATVPLGTDIVYDNDGIVAPDAVSTTTLTDVVPVDLDQDFGYAADGAIGDTIWLDLNGNGVQDAGEPPLAGVPVLVVGAGVDGIFGTSDDLLFLTVTDADGMYLVEGLPAGLFTVTAAPITPGLSPTFDADGGLDSTSAITLGVGETNLDQDFAFTGAGSIGDTIYLDLDGDGQQDPGEPGVPGVTVVLEWGGPDGVLGTPDDETILTVTGPDGTYLFPGLPPSEYEVSVGGDLPTLATNTDDPDAADGETGDSAATLVLADGEDNLDQDFGYQGDNAIGDTVFYDVNGDGIQGPGEPGVADVFITVTWFGPDGVPGGGDDVVLPPVPTDENGAYLVTGLPDGTYSVSVDQASLPAGITTPTYDEDSGAAAPDLTTVVSVAGGEVHDTADFGVTGGGSVGDTIYLDVNGNGNQDPGEPGIPGVTVTVTSGGADGVIGTPDDIVVIVVTDEDGQYLAPNLPPGPVTVTVTDVPDNLVPTDDPDGVLDLTSTIDLGVDEANLDQDFGLAGDGTVGDTVFIDIDGDGEQGPGEPGAPGVTVTVTTPGPDGVLGTPDDVVVVVVTDDNGTYLVENVPAGPVQVTIDPTTLPIGTAPGSDLDGGSAISTVIDLASGGSNLDIDFGLVGTGCIEGVIFNDANGNGVQDPGEAGIGGVTVVVTISTDVGLVTIEVVTAADGSYEVCGLPPGPALVSVDPSTLPPGVPVPKPVLVEVIPDSIVRVDFPITPLPTVAVTGTPVFIIALYALSLLLMGGGLLLRNQSGGRRRRFA